MHTSCGTRLTVQLVGIPLYDVVGGPPPRPDLNTS